MQVVPGEFSVKLTVGEWSQMQPLTVSIVPSARRRRWRTCSSSTISAKRLPAEIDLLFETLTDLRDVKSQSSDIVARMKKAGQSSDEEIADRCESRSNEKLSELEKKITQVNSKSGQDPINFPPMIDNQLTTLYSYVVMSDYEPTAGAYERFDDSQTGSRRATHRVPRDRGVGS